MPAVLPATTLLRHNVVAKPSGTLTASWHESLPHWPGAWPPSMQEVELPVLGKTIELESVPMGGLERVSGGEGEGGAAG